MLDWVYSVPVYCLGCVFGFGFGVLTCRLWGVDFDFLVFCVIVIFCLGVLITCGVCVFGAGLLDCLRLGVGLGIFVV